MFRRALLVLPFALVLALTPSVSLGQRRPEYLVYGGIPFAGGYSYPSWAQPTERAPSNFYYYPQRYPDGGPNRSYVAGTPYSGYHPLFPHLRFSAVDGVVEEGEEPKDVAARYLKDARKAFREQKYGEAAKLGAMSAVAQYDDPKLHQLLTLAMFADEDYLGAAVEARAAIHYGEAPDTESLSLYEDRDHHGRQLEKLEAAIEKHPIPSAPAFVLAYHYLLLDRKDDAKAALKDCISYAPNDEMAKCLLRVLEQGPEEKDLD